MIDSLGRLWKVAKLEGDKPTRLVIYTKAAGGSPKILHELDIAFPGERHASRKRTNGLACNGQLYGPGTFGVCDKCAAMVNQRR